MQGEIRHAWLREPLLHFLLLGSLLFGLYGWLHRALPGAGDTVLVDQARVQVLAAQFEKTWQRAPTRQEVQGLIDNWVREEIIYREGLAEGLARDDEVVRRRIVQKMSFLADDLASDVPSDAELQSWLDQHPERYRLSPRYTLQQIYFDPARHGASLQADVQAALLLLQRQPQAQLGDSTQLPAHLQQADNEMVARNFGAAFAEQLAALPIAQWSGPVASSFGLHLVRIEAREPARLPTLAEVRPSLERDLLNQRQQQSAENFYAQLRQRYRVQQSAQLNNYSAAVVP